LKNEGKENIAESNGGLYFELEAYHDYFSTFDPSTMAGTGVTGADLRKSFPPVLNNSSNNTPNISPVTGNIGQSVIVALYC
jgi:hypothetical protein